MAFFRIKNSRVSELRKKSFSSARSAFSFKAMIWYIVLNRSVDGGMVMETCLRLPINLTHREYCFQYTKSPMFSVILIESRKRGGVVMLAKARVSML